MDLTQVHVGVHKLKRKKRVGRGVGSGHGKTASRGSKGQWASAGQMPLFRRMPKRGFSHATWDRHFLVVNLREIDAAFQDGETVDQATLKVKRLANGPADGIRVLGVGDLTKKLTIRAHHFSKSALEKIAAKGGTAEVIPPPKKPVKNKMKPKKAKDHS
jgi:large subunit ribosomal protein L15